MTITQLTFSTPFELRNAIDDLRREVVSRGGSKEIINIRPGVIELVERTLTDGSKVYDIAIAQVGN